MLDPAIIPIASDVVDGGLASRDKTVNQQIDAKRNYLAARGMLTSGAAIYEMANLFGEELRTVAATIWTALTNTLGAMPPLPTTELKADVQGAFTSMIEQRYQTLLAIFSQAFVQSGDRDGATGKQLIGRVYGGILKQYLAEVALWTAAYLRSNNSSNAPPTYVFQGAVGSVQTGPHAISHVVQNISSADIDSIVAALDQLLAQINIRADIDDRAKLQADKLTQEIKRELSSTSRNENKLRGLFFGLSTFVQSLAAAPQAYAVIQSTAIALGLM